MIRLYAARAVCTPMPIGSTWTVAASRPGLHAADPVARAVEPDHGHSAARATRGDDRPEGGGVVVADHGIDVRVALEQRVCRLLAARDVVGRVVLAANDGQTRLLRPEGLPLHQVLDSRDGDPDADDADLGVRLDLLQHLCLQVGLRVAALPYLRRDQRHLLRAAEARVDRDHRHALPLGLPQHRRRRLRVERIEDDHADLLCEQLLHVGDLLVRAERVVERDDSAPVALALGNDRPLQEAEELVRRDGVLEADRAGASLLDRRLERGRQL